MPRQNRAWLGCRSYEWAFRADAPLWEGDVPQARAETPGASIENVARTHNTFTTKERAQAALNEELGIDTDVEVLARDALPRSGYKATRLVDV